MIKSKAVFVRNNLLSETVAKDLLGFVALPHELPRLDLLRLALRSNHRGGGAINVGGGIFGWLMIGDIVPTGVGRGCIVVSPDPTHT